ncbi:protein phosphatase 2C domain-containing protein [Scytonema sp. PRP1]|uniref:protein phosphatase 2C domain-containing protein n=1 Tax=Scytonema sp. PRP1 TaxID=3120513 RepID=UPI00300CDBFB
MQVLQCFPMVKFSSGAVSDGMGSAAHSELGSHITVKVVVSQLSQEDWLSEPLDERFVSRVLELR